jgi:hypothetical protein
MRAFRFMAASGRRKAPDLVIYGDSRLLCFEAKIRAVDLLRRSTDGFSDVDVQTSAASSLPIRTAMATEAVRRLAAAGRPGETVLSVEFGVIAATSHDEVVQRANLGGLCFVITDVHHGQWHAPVTTPALLALFPAL